jgi:hypothetical protein
MLRAVVISIVALFLLPTASIACCRGVHLLPRHHRALEQRPPLAIGDSVMMAAARRLARAGFEVDAREGRFMRHALKILRRHRRNGTRPRVVVVALGTNMPATYREIRRALALLGPRRTLVLVTPERSWRALDSGAIWAAKRRHPRRVSVLDWAALSVRHPEWFWGDGTHLRPAGARAYARLLRRALPDRPRRTARAAGPSRTITAS